ncbi:MAG: L-threonylcarbamoyladenylate synthase [Candidatus Babeliales bacterium]|jgi:L-threonylcarbamoyladenylate synthase
MSAVHNAKILWWRDELTINLMKKSLEEDYVSITATDTVLGFLARPSEKTHTIIDTIKGSKPDKPYLILIGSPQKLSAFVDVEKLSEEVKCITKKCWPGPLTIIFNAKKNLPRFIQSKDGTVAIRCPRHTGLLNLLAHFEGVFSTSANKSGAPVSKTSQELSPELLMNIDYVVLDHQDVPAQLPSTIIDVTSSKIKLVRPGAYPIEKLEHVCGSRIVL